MGVKHAVLTDGQLQTATITVHAQRCGQKSKETEMGAAIVTKNGKGMTLNFRKDGIAQWGIVADQTKICILSLQIH